MREFRKGAKRKKYMYKKRLKKGILVVSFGTTHTDALESCIGSCEDRIRRAYAGYEVRRAFTSGIVIKRLKQNYGMEADGVDDALAKMERDGFYEVIVQPLHIIPGIEYEDVKKTVQRYSEERVFEKIVLGKPALYCGDDYTAAVDALKGQLPDLESGYAVLLMAHGTSHFTNACFCQLQLALQYNKLDSVYVATAEGYPTIGDIVPLLKSRGISRVTLMPFMLVVGDHAVNDMAGEGVDSWSSILRREGYAVDTYMHGLGENTAFQDIYVEHIKDCIDMLNSNVRDIHNYR